VSRTPTLAELQTAVRNTVLGASSDALAGVIAGDGLGHAARLDVYRNNTTLLLREALAANFPVVSELVGEDFFAQLARAFLRGHPPSSPCLFEYGEAFPDFIASDPAAAELPYLPDVARLEWAWNEAFHAHNTPALTASALGTVAPEDYPHLVFAPHPALRMVSSPYPIYTIWALHQPDADPDATVDLAQGGETVMVTRPETNAQVCVTSTGAAIFTDRLRAGENLADAFAMAAEMDPAFDGGAVIAQLLTQGALATFDLV